jgi:hypothetical protein
MIEFFLILIAYCGCVYFGSFFHEVFIFLKKSKSEELIVNAREQCRREREQELIQKYPIKRKYEI